MEGKGYIREEGSEDLAKALKSVLKHTAPDCLIGIPTMDPAGPKYTNWKRHEDRFMRFFQAGDKVRYYSAFITRPDSAPAIETREYCELMQRLWIDKARVSVVSEPASKLLAIVRRTNADVHHVECPRHGAFAHIDRLESEAMSVSPDLVILSVGPTATILANRITKLGVQALDLGSVGGFLARCLSN